MSELNEDILNYEIGDVDDTDLAGADEDELLLSDEESISQDQEDDLLSESRTEKTSRSDSDVTNKTVKKQSIIIKTDIEQLAPANISNLEPQPKSLQKESACVSSESDFVSSTNRDDEDDFPFPQECDKSESERDVQSEDKNSESTSIEESDKNLTQSENTDTKTESTIVSSQETPQEDGLLNNGFRSTSDDFDTDDLDDFRERRNPKTCVERETPHSLEDTSKPKNFAQFQRNRHPRGPAPRLNNPLYTGGGNNDNFNQQAFMPQQYRGGPRRPMVPGLPNDFMRNPNMGMMRGPGPHRMPMLGMPPHPNRLQGPPNIGLPHQRMLRPPFQAQQIFNPGMPPQGMMRPRIPAPNVHPMMSQNQPFGQFPTQAHQVNVRPPMPPNTSMPITQVMNVAVAIPNQSPQLPLAIGGSRKVLINPNFKGGVQAATNQLMMDTMKNSQLLENTREAELLRQQEEFINQNRMHIEKSKRRRSREYSPERNHRDRDRSRSFSPPRRRERDGRRPYTNFRDNRTRRADSKERDNIDPKGRRADSDGNNDKNNPKTEEDEETRAYRLEIEKQKALREKVLRDKEMRRRQAAEDIKKEEDKKPVDSEPLQKLKPIIVTEKKIISLKKKAGETANDNTLQMPKAATLTRRVESASSDVTSENPIVLRTTGGIPNKKNRIETDDIDEDELLADSPPPTPKPTHKPKNSLKTSEPVNIPTSLLANRRIVIRNPNDASNTENISDKSSGSGKGIFDRLDKRMIGVNEAAKRKIQRIVINNSD